jgi:hypothetical protein
VSDHFEGARLSDGRRLAVIVPSRSAYDVRIQLLRGDSVIDEALLPYPTHGLGGGRILLSPTERLAVFAYSSGQSEEAYDVFRVSDMITRVGGVPYEYGREASYGFSQDERLLVMALPRLSYEWWSLVECEEALPDGRGNLVVEFGRVRVHDLSTGHVSAHELRAVVREGWRAPDSEDAYDAALHPRFTADQQLSLSLPWGEARVPLPLAATVDLEVK